MYQEKILSLKEIIDSLSTDVYEDEINEIYAQIDNVRDSNLSREDKEKEIRKLSSKLKESQKKSNELYDIITSLKKTAGSLEEAAIEKTLLNAFSGMLWTVHGQPMTQTQISKTTQNQIEKQKNVES